MSFLNYIGECTYDGNDLSYKFKMKKGKALSLDSYINIPNPIIDNMFKQVFAKNTEISKSLLNSFLYPKEESIIKVEFLPTEIPGHIEVFPEPIKLNSLDSIRVDVLCKCTLKDDAQTEKVNNKINDLESEEENKEDKANEEMEDEKNEEINKINEIKKEEVKEDIQTHMDLDDQEKKTIIIDLEMQLGFSNENTKRFIKYAKELNYLYGSQIIVLALVNSGTQNPRKNKGTLITLEQSNIPDYKRIFSYDDYKIYQVDLDFCHKLILKDKPFWILNKEEKVKEKGMEWIQYLTIPNWCTSFINGYYAFPPLNREFFINENIYEAFKIIFNQNGINYRMSLYDQTEKEKKVKDYIKVKKQNEELIKENISLKEENEKLKKLMTKSNESKRNKKNNKRNKRNKINKKNKKKEKYNDDEDDSCED